jgi:two-component system chemotaxis sensor kinase CheA
MNQVGELVVSRAYFAQLVNEMRGLQQQLLEHSKMTKGELKPLHEFAFRLSEAGVHLGRVSNELQEGVMKIRMLPIEQLFKRYPRLVRDLTHRTHKDIRLITKGEETELDKMVIESMSDPLIHIIRNAVDHGIETVEERKRLGKPAQGSLMLEAYHESDHIVLEISDDGRGIDPRRIRLKAAAKGLFSSEELGRMSDLEVLRIIMEPGFSTAEKATETSGRGVGMDVVKKNIERLNGMIEISSKVGQGTKMRIKIPLTMAIIQALMVRVGQEKFTIPLTTVEETLRIFRHEISVIEGVNVIHIRDITMPIFRLDKIYHIQRSEENEEKMFVVVVSTGTQEVGLVVDELIGQEEVVIKPLADYLRVESGFGGATILGDGGISLILDIPELVKLAAEDQADKQEERARTYQRKRRKRVGGTEAAQSQTVH